MYQSSLFAVEVECFRLFFQRVIMHYVLSSRSWALCCSKPIISSKGPLFFYVNAHLNVFLFVFREEVNKLKQSEHRRRQIEVHNRKLLLRIQVNNFLKPNTSISRHCNTVTYKSRFIPVSTLTRLYQSLIQWHLKG